MPPCRPRISQTIRECDLPILTFLAPRVFQPWPLLPSIPSRKHSTSSTVQKDTPARSRYGFGRLPCGSCHTLSSGVSASTLTPRASFTTDVANPASRDHRVSGSRRKGSMTPRLRETSKQRTAKQWYEGALLDLEELLVDRSESDWNSRQRDRRHTPWSATDGQAQNLDSSVEISGDKQARKSKLEEVGTKQSESKNDRLVIRRLEQKKPIQESAERQMAHKMNVMRVKAKTRARWKWGLQHRSKFSKTRKKLISLGRPVRNRDESSATPTGAPEETEDHPNAATELLFFPGDFSSLWNHNIAKLQRRYDTALQDKGEAYGDLIIHSNASEWARAILETPGNRVNRHAIVHQDGQHYSWSSVWSHAMLWTLAHDIDNAARFLHLTHLAPLPPPSWIADALHVLVKHYTAMPFVEQSTWDEIITVFPVLLDRQGADALGFSSGHIRWLLPHCSEVQVRKLSESIREHNVKLHGHTLLHVATRLTHFDLLDEALDQLLQAAGSGARIDSAAFKSTCATILRKAIDQPDGLRLCLRIISNLVDLGVVLNVQLCNIVMLNAVEAGDLKTAFSAYHSLVEHGLAADEYTYAILLKGCKMALADGDALNKTIRHAIRSLDIHKAPVVATEIIHCLTLHHFHHTPETAFTKIAEAYISMFDARPLIELGIFKADCQQEDGLMEPTSAVLGVLITTYLRSQQTANVARQHSMYRRFRSLAQYGSEPFATLCETDHVSNAFLMAFTKHSYSMPFAAEVMRDMQAPAATIEAGYADTNPLPTNVTPTNAPNAAAAPATPTPTLTTPPRAQCPPTARTWSIFLHGFTKHKKMALAEQVLGYMREKGIRPNQVTWNTLINGYAGVQDAEGAIEALQRMEAEGVTGNDITAKAMANARRRSGVNG